MATRLRVAREAAIEAKMRVAEVGGELYYSYSDALDAADAARAVQRGVMSGLDAPRACGFGVLDARWLHPAVSKEQVWEAFGRFGQVTHVQMCMAGDEAPKEPRHGLEYNYANITFASKTDAMAAQAALNGTSMHRGVVLGTDVIAVTLISGAARRGTYEHEPDVDESDLVSYSDDDDDMLDEMDEGLC